MNTSIFPLSSSQMALYLSYQKSPTDTAYNIPVILKFPGQVDLARLTNVVNELAQRHPMMTARIRTNENNEPLNYLIPTDFVVDEIQGYHDDSQSIMKRLLNIAFDLSEGPLIRFYLFQINSNTNIVFIVHHHIIIDFLPFSFIEELHDLYSELSTTNIPPILTPVPGYQAFVNAELEYLKSASSQIDFEYWKNIIGNVLPIDISNFPSAMKPETQQKDFYKLVIDRELYASVKSCARQLGMSPYAIFTSALFLLLHQYTQQKQITLVTLCNNRFYSENENTLGDFSNLILLQINLECEFIVECVQLVWKTIITALKHGRYPNYELLKKLNIANELFQVAIVHHDWKKKTAIEMGLELCQLPDHPIMFEIIEEMDQAFVLIKYKESIFSLNHIKRISLHYLSIIHTIVNEKSSKLTQLNLLSEEEKNYLLAVSNPNPVKHDSIYTLHQLFERSLKTHRSNVAIVQGERTISYQALNQHANQLARFIRGAYESKYELEIENGTLVILYCDRGIDAIIAMLAILKAGAAYLPIDISHPDDRIDTIIKHSKANVILTNQVSNNAILEKHRDKLILDITSNQPTIASYSDCDLNMQVSEKQLAYVIYTSGTTGTPNGVAIMHHGVCNLAIGQGKFFDIIDNTAVLQFASLAFDASVSEIWCTLIQGGTLYLPVNQLPLIGEALRDFLLEYKIEVATLPPSVLATIEPERMFLKTLIVAGESASGLLLDTWSGKVNKLLNAYGPTEATVCATMHQYHRKDAVCNIGKPLSNVSVFILDANLSLVPIGITGEIYISGVGVAVGYLYNTELTRAKFISHSLCAPGQLLYKTNDKGRYLEDGSIEYRGRTDNQIKISGYRVELEEIEKTILTFNFIKQVTVLLDKEGDESRLVAFIVPQMQDFQLDNLTAKLTKLLPAYMRPCNYHIIKAMPLTANGKIDKKQLIALRQVPALNQTISSVPHSDSLENNFISMCAEILKVEFGAVRMEQHFLEQGGTSLLILQLLSRIKSTFKIALSIQDLFGAPSLHAVLALIKSKHSFSLTTIDADLENDLRIIVPATSLNKALPTSINHILLTGATGFLGVNVLIKLLELSTARIYCIVRASCYEDALGKLQRAFEKYSSKKWDEARIVVLTGDISCPEFGLSESLINDLSLQVDCIYHCGAFVNHLYTYQMLRATNVLSTVEVIKFATRGKIKRIHYISTIDTVASGDADYDSESFPLSSCKLKWGYVQSKWVCEKILANNSIPMAIYRPGNITGHSIKGTAEPDKNHALCLLKSCISSGVAPDFQSKIEMTPVDVLSEMIVNISLQQTDKIQAFYNLHNPNSLTWSEYISIVNKFGYNIRIIPYQIWKSEYLAKLKENDSLAVFKPIYEDNEIDKLTLPPEKIKTRNISGILEEIGMSHIRDYQPLVNRYLDYLMQSGFLADAKLRIKNDER